jgi:hypothetical protein
VFKNAPQADNVEFRRTKWMTLQRSGVDLQPYTRSILDRNPRCLDSHHIPSRVASIQKERTIPTADVKKPAR